MQTHPSRRSFLAAATTALASGLAFRRATAVDPLQRPGRPTLRLGLAAYSFRDFFKDPAKIDLPKFIDYCADHQLEGAELTSYYFPKDPTADFLLELKRRAFLRGVAISGTSVGNNFALPDGEERTKELDYVRKWIDHAAVMGAPHIRVFAGSPKGISDQEGRRQVIKGFEECCAYAGTKGIFLGLENHGGVVATATGMLEIIRAVNSPWFGVNLDTGNFHSEDPYAELAQCAPYAVNVQVKVEMTRGKQPAEPADLKKLAHILRQANYQGFVTLEYEAKPDPWQAVPEHLKRLREAIS